MLSRTFSARWNSTSLKCSPRLCREDRGKPDNCADHSLVVPGIICANCALSLNTLCVMLSLMVVLGLNSSSHLSMLYKWMISFCITCRRSVAAHCSYTSYTRFTRY